MEIQEFIGEDLDRGAAVVEFGQLLQGEEVDVVG